MTPAEPPASEPSAAAPRRGAGRRAGPRSCSRSRRCSRVAGLALALRLQPDAGVDTLVGTSSPAYAATQTLRERFGDDAIIVLVRGDLQQARC